MSLRAQNLQVRKRLIMQAASQEEERRKCPEVYTWKEKGSEGDRRPQGL
jgi:hypothetical protein